MADRRRLRVCLLSEGFYPEVLGGMEVHAHGLAERLWDLGVECEALARPVRRETPRERYAGRILVRHLGVAGQFKGAGLAAAMPLALFAAKYGAWLALRRGHYDVVMALGSKSTPVPGLVARTLAGLPLVLVPQTTHEFAEPISAESLARGGGAVAHGLLAPWQRLRGDMLRRADTVVAISEEIARSLRALGVGEGRIERIPNGIDVERFRPVPADRKAALRARLGLPADRALLAFVGRLSRAKGVLALTEVWADLSPRHPDAHLLLVGAGGDSFDDCEAELRALVAARGLAGSVTLAGATDDVPAHLQAADAFVFPSEHEGFGLALLEAMACGLPVVTTRVGVAAEVVDNPTHGRLVAPRDPAALLAAIEDLLARRARWPEMGVAARAAVVDGYGMDAVAARYARLLRRVAEYGDKAA